jgi:DNA-binding HxlR family transcriptional regulator
MDFPEHIKRALEALGDKNRRKILLSLEPPNNLTYSEIKELLNEDISSKGTITYHLHKLESAGLISNYVEFAQGNRVHSYYEATPLCKELIESIFSVYEGKNKTSLLPIPTATNYSWAETTSSSTVTTYISESNSAAFNKNELLRTPV